MPVDVLYVSPHPDDVAFSAAAQVARDVATGSRVGVLTVFEMPGTAQGGLFGDRAVRRAEDEAFAALVGAERIAAGFDDAVARRARYRHPYHLLGPLPDDEAPLVEDLRDRLQSLVRQGCRRVVAPLGVGEHVDHQIAHQAARALSGVDVAFYEDTPHVLADFALARRLSRAGLEPVIGGGAPARLDPAVARGSRLGEIVAGARTWWSLPLLDAWLGVRAGAPRPLWLGVARSLAIGYLFGPSLLRPGSMRAHGEPRRAAPFIVRGPEVAAVKLAAIGVYASQWPGFRRTLDGWREALERYARALGEDGMVERAWRVDPAPAIVGPGALDKA